MCQVSFTVEYTAQQSKSQHKANKSLCIISLFSLIIEQVTAHNKQITVHNLWSIEQITAHNPPGQFTEGSLFFTGGDKYHSYACDILPPLIPLLLGGQIFFVK